MLRAENASGRFRLALQILRPGGLRVAGALYVPVARSVRHYARRDEVILVRTHAVSRKVSS
jgi:hypothetical protein